jgi:hypothetical protein
VTSELLTSIIIYNILSSFLSSQLISDIITTGDRQSSTVLASAYLVHTTHSSSASVSGASAGFSMHYY